MAVLPSPTQTDCRFIPGVEGLVVLPPSLMGSSASVLSASTADQKDKGTRDSRRHSHTAAEQCRRHFRHGACRWGEGGESAPPVGGEKTKQPQRWQPLAERTRVAAWRGGTGDRPTPPQKNAAAHPFRPHRTGPPPTASRERGELGREGIREGGELQTPSLPCLCRPPATTAVTSDVPLAPAAASMRSSTMSAPPWAAYGSQSQGPRRDGLP